MNAKTSRLLGSAAALSVVAALAAGGCSNSNDHDNGGSGNPPPPVVDDNTVIPVSAGASGTALVSYVKTLSAEEVINEPKTFAAGFTDPPEDTDEPLPAS